VLVIVCFANNLKQINDDMSSAAASASRSHEKINRQLPTASSRLHQQKRQAFLTFENLYSPKNCRNNNKLKNSTNKQR